MSYFLAPGRTLWLDRQMMKACLLGITVSLLATLPLPAYDWETTHVSGRDYVTLHSFCGFYHFAYEHPSGDTFRSSNGEHTIFIKNGSGELYLDGVHYVLSFPIESGDGDFLVSRMDVIKLFDPILRPTQIPGRHSIRGIVLDPGHGGTDNGAVSPQTHGMEKNYTRDTAFRVEEILREKYNIRVVLTRRTDVFVDLYERARIAAQYPDYAFVSIHYNSASPEAHGLETYCLAPRGAASSSYNYVSRADIMKQPGNDTDAANILLASYVHNEIVRLNPKDISADRGVKRARFAVLRVNSLPAILVEGGFVSNRFESRVLDTSTYRQKLAEAISRGIIKFINVMSGRNIPIEVDQSVATTVETTPPKKSTKGASALAPAKTQDTASALPPGAVPVKPVRVVEPDSSKKDKFVADKVSDTVSKKSKSKKDKLKDKTQIAAKSGDVPVATPATQTNTVIPTPELSGPPIAAPNQAPPATNKVTIMDTNATPLNLSEPAAPVPTPGSDKAPPEPEEPPTVNAPSDTNEVKPPESKSSSTSKNPPTSSNTPAEGAKEP